MTVAVVHHLVHGGISKNHCSKGNCPIMPPPPPAPSNIAAMVVCLLLGRAGEVRERLSDYGYETKETGDRRAKGECAIVRMLVKYGDVYE